MGLVIYVMMLKIASPECLKKHGYAKNYNSDPGTDSFKSHPRDLVMIKALRKGTSALTWF